MVALVALKRQDETNTLSACLKESLGEVITRKRAPIKNPTLLAP